MNIKISSGNTKLGSIPNLNLPPVKTCREGVPCAKDCYAMKAWRQYPNVRSAWQSNLDLYKNDPHTFFGRLHKYLRIHRPYVFRVHSAGDIPDEKYWDYLRRVMPMYPETTFLIFTKRYDYDFIGLPSNVSVVLSIWPGLELPDNTDLPWAWLKDDSRMPADAYYSMCPGSCDDCRVCWDKLSSNVHVCFRRH